MTGNRVGARRARTRNKALALTATGVVLAAAITVPSLAAWTDIEWVIGGAGADDTTGGGITASTFEVEQAALQDGENFGHYETEAGANVISFGDAAAALTPGDTVYAFVRLRTVTGSLGGTLTLAADTDTSTNALADVLTYGARTVASPAACNAAGYTGAGSNELQAPGTPLDEVAPTATFSLSAATAAAPGPEVVVCFALTLPDTQAIRDNDALQSLSVAPVWHFDAVSVSTP